MADTGRLLDSHIIEPTPMSWEAYQDAVRATDPINYFAISFYLVLTIFIIYLIITYMSVDITDQKNDDPQNSDINKSDSKENHDVLMSLDNCSESNRVVNEVKFEYLMKFIIIIKAHFRQEWAWRLFVVLQCVGIFCIFYMDITSKWNFFPYSHFDGIIWDFLEERYWRGYSKNLNWFLLLFLFGPFLFSKACSWIASAK